MNDTESIYCAEQISIPPTFPYLLRQYAKAAIRTQPVDLLKWSTTYFRCLSLNCPPPVKNRLEYPIPKDWHGLTPGWIKSLYLQIHPSSTIDFKVLWDRWTGSCFEHDNLIEILCLGGFEDAKVIPWLKFIGLCVAMMCDSLTKTMIMVCEILTEEPEGASSSIPLESFLTVYTFLAAIDASEDRWYLNKFFTDSQLDLWKEKKEKFEQAKKQEEPEEEEEVCSEPEICQFIPEREEEKVEVKEEDSCPSIGDEDFDKIENYLEADEKTENTEEEEQKEAPLESEETEAIPVVAARDVTETAPSENGESTQDTDEITSMDKARRQEFKTDERQAFADMDDRQREQYEQNKLEGKSGKEVVEPQDPDFEERGLLEDLAKLKALQEEMRGEDDDELEEFKKELMKQLQKTPSELEAISHFASELKDQEEKEVLVVQAEDAESKIESLEDEEELPEFDDVFVSSKPGIGRVVPENLVMEVEKYMREVAKVQHGMVMPRNLRHYDCPPLEEVDNLEREVKFLDGNK